MDICGRACLRWLELLQVERLRDLVPEDVSRCEEPTTAATLPVLLVKTTSVLKTCASAMNGSRRTRALLVFERERIARASRFRQRLVLAFVNGTGQHVSSSRSDGGARHLRPSILQGVSAVSHRTHSQLASWQGLCSLNRPHAPWPYSPAQAALTQTHRLT